jgi:hypothetical protein
MSRPWPEIPGQAVKNLAFDVPKMNAPPADTPIPYNQLFDQIRNHFSFCQSSPLINFTELLVGRCSD